MALSYAALRRRAFVLALRQAARRWGVYLLVLAAAAGAGSSDPLQAAASLPVMLVWPLHAAWQAGWNGAPGLVAWVAASTLAALVPLGLTRRWWWPPRWAEAERALPLAADELRRCDAQVVRLLVLPWHALTGLGLLLAGAGAGLGAWLAMATAWAAALAGSLALGRALLARLRRRSAEGARGGSHAARAVAAAPVAWTRGSPSRQALQRWRTWSWLPLRRGAARGTARLLLLFGVANPALAMGPVATPEATGWWLAALSITALAGTSWLRGRIAIEWAAWRVAAAPWPMPPSQWQAQARALALLPVLLGTLALVLALAALAARAATDGAASPRAAVACSFVIALPLACWLEARPPADDAAHQAARWLLLLAVLVALGTEVMA